LQVAVGSWSDDSAMRAFQPAMIHGDPNAPNFLFPTAGGLTVIDWEHLTTGDPAADLGRLLAEITHSARELQPRRNPAFLRAVLLRAYQAAVPGAAGWGPFVQRARFFEAMGHLRIAQNTWLPVDTRCWLAEAGARLLSDRQLASASSKSLTTSESSDIARDT